MLSPEDTRKSCPLPPAGPGPRQPSTRHQRGHFPERERLSHECGHRLPDASRRQACRDAQKILTILDGI